MMFDDIENKDKKCLSHTPTFLGADVRPVDTKKSLA